MKYDFYLKILIFQLFPRIYFYIKVFSMYLSSPGVSPIFLIFFNLPKELLFHQNVPVPLKVPSL